MDRARPEGMLEVAVGGSSHGVTVLTEDQNLMDLANRRQATRDPSWPGTVRCLVVDDDDLVRGTVGRGLRRFGYDVLLATSGAEALALLEQEPVNVVLSDYHMPGMNGLELLQAIRASYPDVAVVIATSVSEVSVAVSCLQMGAQDFLTKPFQLDDVRARITQALEKQQLIHENWRYHHNLEEMVREQASRIEELFLEGVQAVAHALDARDSYTHGHSARVRAYAGAIAREMGLPADVVHLTELGAELHDIGKIGVGDDLLLKPGRLTNEEYLRLMEHPIRGEEILKGLLKNAPLSLAIVRSHHERLDGAGFPDGLVGDEIPLPVRIVTLADSFDAMTTARPYRGAQSATWALAEVAANCGSQFDPEVAAAFRSAYSVEGALPIVTPALVPPTLPTRVAGFGRLSF